MAAPEDGFGNRFVLGIYKLAAWPGEKLRALTAGSREKNKSVYYHRKYKRVTPIEDCEEDDSLCHFEANFQYNRDRMIDEEILSILRQRYLECCVYYQQDQRYKCKKENDDVQISETNYFAKYGDLGVGVSKGLNAFRKQQHRMIWERRNGVSLIDGKPLSKDESDSES